jgi:hypothetical protein
VRRLPQAAGKVVAQAQRHDSRGHQRGIAAARAARPAGGVLRMIRPPPHRIVGLVKKHRLGNVRLADHDRAGRPQPRHQIGVGGIDRLAQGRDPQRRPQPGDGEAFLHAHRHPGQRSDSGTSLGGRRRESLLNERVEPAVGLAVAGFRGDERRRGSDEARRHGSMDVGDALHLPPSTSVPPAPGRSSVAQNAPP